MRSWTIKYFHFINLSVPPKSVILINSTKMLQLSSKQLKCVSKSSLISRKSVQKLHIKRRGVGSGQQDDMTRSNTSVYKMCGACFLQQQQKCNIRIVFCVIKLNSTWNFAAPHYCMTNWQALSCLVLLSVAVSVRPPVYLRLSTKITHKLCTRRPRGVAVSCCYLFSVLRRLIATSHLVLARVVLVSKNQASGINF